MRIFLVDDHELIRCGVREALVSQGHEIVAESNTVADARARCGVLDIDAAVVDLRLPDGSGLEVVRYLRQLFPEAGIVVLTMFPTDDALFDAMDAGANALVGKEVPLLAITHAVAHAAADPRSFHAKDLTAAMRRRMQPAEPLLTTREAEVLAVLADGLSIGQVARRLCISESTAKTHAARLYQKLGAGNRAQAVMEAVRRGILPVDAASSAL